MNASIQALENQYELLRGSLSDFEAKGATEDQLDTLRKAIAQSRDNYWKATQSILHDDDPEVVALTSQMNTIQVALDQEVKKLENIANVLNKITKAVDIGSQLAAKAVAL
jgi:allophanate hydrolase subunit 1